MPEPTLFLYRDFLYNPALEGNCPHSYNVSFGLCVETSSELVVVLKNKKMLIMKCWKIFILYKVSHAECVKILHFIWLSPHRD